MAVEKQTILNASRPTLPGTALAAILALLVPAGAPGATGADADSASRAPAWTRVLQPGLSRGDLGLPASASERALARAALERKARRLGLRTGLRLDRQLRLPAEQGGATIRDLRFQQTIGSLRLAWSQIDVSIVKGEVSSITATVVPARPRLATDERRVGRKRALRIARRAVRGRDRALTPLAAAYAGMPTTDRRADARRARRVWIVEVQRDRNLEIQASLCLAVDAATGRVIGRWPGMADRPDQGPKARGTKLGAPPESVAARDARDNPSYTLMTRDGTGESDPDPLEMEPYAVFVTDDDPRVSSNWPFYIDARLPQADPGTAAMDAVSANTANVARTICVVRGWCGREGGFQPDATVVKPWLVVGNTNSGSRADRATLDVTLSAQSVILGSGDPNVPANDIVAHEFGHVMDWVYAGDRFAGGKTSQQAFEVEEGLADMFAYEYDRADALIGEETPGGTRIDMADPNSIDLGGQPYPDHFDDYDPTPPLDADDDPDYHYNGTILSHAYYLLVQRVGHPKAGRLLHNVPSLLSPRPTFREVSWGFYLRALQIYGVATSTEAREAFTEVGLPPSPQFPTPTP
jgi:Thermolysin metallopeptidase, alpha-helical domain